MAQIYKAFCNDLKNFEAKHKDLYGRFPMDSVFTLNVIICTKTRRGKGVEGDPIRVITEVFTKEGDLIAEYDPQTEVNQSLAIQNAKK